MKLQEQHRDRLVPSPKRSSMEKSANHATAWDRQFAADAEFGRLDALADEALSDSRAGRTRPP